MKKNGKDFAKLKERGQSMVELALVLTLLLIITAGLVDFGRAFFALISLNDAAQEGATYASFNPTDVTGIQNRATSSSTDPIDLANDPNMATVLIQYNNDTTPPIAAGAQCAGFYGGSGNPNSITVLVPYQFNFTMPLIDRVIQTSTITLHGSATSTILYPPCP